MSPRNIVSLAACLLTFGVTLTAAAQEDAAPPQVGYTFATPARAFEPLLADPRWPHFYGSIQRYLGDPNLEHVGSVGFGESFAFVGYDFENGDRIEAGLQAGVFAIFDLDAPSHDLVNADYFVAGTASYRRDRLSAVARLYHQSSHLGDEFLLRNTGVRRIDFRYEVVDAIASYDAADGLRVYGGVTYIFNANPEDYGPLKLQYGVELAGPAFAGDYLRPVAAIDVQHREENDFAGDVSLRAGIEATGLVRYGNRVQVSLEYFNGHSPNGQFYEETVRYVGVGLHYYF